MDLSIIIVNYNVYDHVFNCIHAIKKSIQDLEYEILVIDNNSEEHSFAKLPLNDSNINFIKLNRNIGFGAANNIGLKYAKGQYILILNPDVIVKASCINNLLIYLTNNKNVGMVTPALYRPDGSIDYYYSFFPSMYSIIMQQFGFYNIAKLMKSRMFHYFDENINKDKPFMIGQAMGACILTRKCIYDSIGGFDEVFFLYQEETDWEYRMKKEGWKIMMLPAAIAVHDHHSAANKLGRIFVGFQGLRSILIYSVKHFSLPNRTILRITMLIALLFRFMKYCITYLFKPKKLFESIYYVLVLFLITLTPKNILLKSRYDFERRISI